MGDGTRRFFTTTRTTSDRSGRTKTPVLEQEVTAITPAASNSNTKTRVPLFQSRLLPVVVIGVILGAGAIASAIYAYRQWQYSQNFPQTDNAYITADVYPVIARVSGIVSQIPINENQVVAPGTVLVKLDPQDNQVSLAQATASLELAKQQAALAQKKIRNIPVPTSGSQLSPADNNTQARQNFLQAQAIQQRDISEQQYKTALAAIAQKQAEVKKLNCNYPTPILMPWFLERLVTKISKSDNG